MSGGMIVFDPEATFAKLVANSILIGDEGAMVIGSKDCKFEGNAEVLLTGNIFFPFFWWHYYIDYNDMAKKIILIFQEKGMMSQTRKNMALDKSSLVLQQGALLKFMEWKNSLGQD